MVPDLPIGTVVAGIIGSVVGVGIVFGSNKISGKPKET